MNMGSRTVVVGCLFVAVLFLAPVGSAAVDSSALPRGSESGLRSDFNGDGFADLAVGVPFEDLAGVPDAGAVNVLYGSAGGLQADSPNDQLWHQDSPGVQDVAEELDEFGFSLAPGDFNGDGFADLAVGAQWESLGGEIFAGAVNVLYGSAGGLQADSPDDQFWHQDSPGVQDVAEGYDYFGSSLAVGDFNGDTFADLAVGARGEGLGESGSAGAVIILHGSAGGLQADAPDDQFWHQDSPGVEDVAEVLDEFASSLAAGDFNGDAFADLAVGVYFEDLGAGFDHGAVNVLYGSAGGLQANSPDDQFWHQDSPGVQDVAERTDYFGFSLAPGDFNRDGFADLAVGVPREVRERVRGGIESAGAVNVLYGSAGGLQADSPDDQFWHQDSPGVEESAEEDDVFGSSLGA